MKTDVTGISCGGKSKQNISPAVIFLLSTWLNSLSWVFKPHLPAPTCTGLPWWPDYTTHTASCSLRLFQLPQNANFWAAPLYIDKTKLLINAEALVQEKIPNRLLHFIPGMRGREGGALLLGYLPLSSGYCLTKLLWKIHLNLYLLQCSCSVWA